MFRQVISLPGPRPAQLTRRLVDFIWQGPELPNTGCCETCFNASCLGRGSPLDGGKIRDGGGGGRGEGEGAYLTLHCHHLKCVCVCVYGGGGILCTIGGRGGTTLSPPEVCVFWEGYTLYYLGGGGGIPNATLSPQRGEVERYLMLHCHHKEGRWNDT